VLVVGRLDFEAVAALKVGKVVRLTRAIEDARKFCATHPGILVLELEHRVAAGSRHLDGSRLDNDRNSASGRSSSWSSISGRRLGDLLRSFFGHGLKWSWLRLGCCVEDGCRRGAEEVDVVCLELEMVTDG
jgi:hypothetical protein